MGLAFSTALNQRPGTSVPERRDAMRKTSVVLFAVAVVLAACEDFEITQHTVMDGSRPPEVVQVPERSLSRSEV